MQDTSEHKFWGKRKGRINAMAMLKVILLCKEQFCEEGVDENVACICMFCSFTWHPF